MVIGAGGRHSLVAEAVRAQRYREHAPSTCHYYAYRAGLSGSAPEFHLMEGRAVGVFPTHDDVACVVAVRPVGDWAAYKRAPESTYRAQLESFPLLAARFGQASQESRFFGSASLAAASGARGAEAGPWWRPPGPPWPSPKLVQRVGSRRRDEGRGGTG